MALLAKTEPWVHGRCKSCSWSLGYDGWQALRRVFAVVRIQARRKRKVQIQPGRQLRVAEARVRVRSTLRTTQRHLPEQRSNKRKGQKPRQKPTDPRSSRDAHAITQPKAFTPPPAARPAARPPASRPRRAPRPRPTSGAAAARTNSPGARRAAPRSRPATVVSLES